ncbi:hypothetical protein PG984_016392 [Apiospora sp. TS-2023a]
MAFNWDHHFDEVRTLYLIDRKPLKEIRKMFEQNYGCTASLKQWTQQLSRWKLKKNLSEKDWKYISHVAKKRKARHKDSLVFVSGAGEDFTLHKSTSSTPTHLSRFNAESDIIGFGLTIFGNTMSHFNSIYREITCYMPDEAPNSHNERAYQIAHGQGLGSVHAMLEVLTFLLSNNILFEKLNSDPESYDRCVTNILESYFKISYSFNGIFSPEDLTIQVVLDEAFASIIRSSRLDLLKRPIIWDLQRSIPLSPIEAALNNGDVRTANYLLSHGAHIDETGINTVRYISVTNIAVYHRCWRIHNTLETVEWILARCTKIKEPKLLHILEGLEDDQRNEKTAALILEKLWQIETSTQLSSPASVLFYAIRFNNKGSIGNLLSCEGRLLQDTVPQGYGTKCATEYEHITDGVHFMPLCEAVYSLDKTLLPRLLGVVSQVRVSQSQNMIWGEALITAAAIGNLHAVELLLETDVDVNWSSRYDLKFGYSKPRIFYDDTPQEAQKPLRAAIVHRHTGAIEELLRAGAELSEDDIMVAIRQDVFDQLQRMLGFRIHITDRILLSLVQNDCLDLLTDIELGTLPWTESHRGGETALGNAIVMNKTELISYLKAQDCLQYDPFALVAGVMTVEASHDRSMIEYMLGLRAVTALSNDHTRLYLELAALFIAVLFQDVETLEMLECLELFECYQAGLSGESHVTFDDTWDIFNMQEGATPAVSDSFLDDTEYLNGQHSTKRILLITSAVISRGVCSLLGLAVGIGANRATMQFLLQKLPKACAVDVLVALKNAISSSDFVPPIAVDPLLIHDLIDLATDVKYWEPPPTYPTILQAAIIAGFDCIALRLIEIGVVVNARPPAIRNGRDALQAACENGNLFLVERLLECGADVNSPTANDGGATALQIAVMTGHIQLATFLLDCNADCNAPGATLRGRTAIEGAAEHGRIDMIELLLAKGVQTTGIYRRQYFRAIRFASEGTHYTAESILRDCRLWDEEDRNEFEETCICDARFYKYYSLCKYTDLDFNDHQRTCPILESLFKQERQNADKQKYTNLVHRGIGTNLMRYKPASDLGGVFEPTVWLRAVDLGGSPLTTEDDAAGGQLQSRTPLQITSSVVEGEVAGNDDWLEDWLNFDDKHEFT